MSKKCLREPIALTIFCRIQHLTLNTMRCMTGTIAFGISFGINKQLPKIEHTNILPAALCSVNYTFLTLTTYVAAVYIPMTAVEAISFTTALLSSLFIFGLLIGSETKWVEVCIKRHCMGNQGIDGNLYVMNINKFQEHTIISTSKMTMRQHFVPNCPIILRGRSRIRP